ncbi:MAG: restriction system protein [Blastocatellia bacterium]|jgi:restriction system protein|nr:restriction system protein [Blastocatellia bacterium]
MGRRSGFGGFIAAAARDQRQAEAAHRRQIREYERSLRQAERNRILSEKEARQRYVEERIQEVEDRNAELVDQIGQLRSILPQTLTLDDSISFESLRVQEEFPAFTPPVTLTGTIPPPTVEPFIAAVKFPNWFQRLFPSTDAKHQRALADAKEKYQAAFDQHNALETQRKAQLEALHLRYEKDREAFLLKARQRNSEVEQFKQRYYAAEVQAIIAYNTMVLERSQYPDGFPQILRVAYSSESKELVIEYELPTPDIIPSVLSCKYVKARDTIEEKPRKQTEIKDLYQDIVAATALRTIHEVFEADKGKHLGVVTLNEFVRTVDPTTGRDIRPCLVSVRVTRDRFDELDLSRIDKRSCLRNLGAQVSARPDERVAVKPLIEFDMVDKRFVDGSDVMGELESRPNLMDLTPVEFENLIGNLFSKMGLETRQTQLSRDGGVDVVAFDKRAILGGKVVIQAKRYRNTVGVSAVRDLYGTMMNEGANKGILVSTAGYGAAAFNFATDKPIELIDGGGLLYLLEHHAGLQARIIMPED